MEAKEIKAAYTDAYYYCFLGEERFPYEEREIPLCPGLTFESLLSFSPLTFEDLVLSLATLDQATLTRWHTSAIAAGHKDHIFLGGMGHVHRSQIPRLIDKAKKHIDSL